MKKDNINKDLELDKNNSIKKDGNEIDKVDELEINKMLEDFELEKIEIPESLDPMLNEKLDSIKPKRNRYLLKGLVACALVIIISYVSIPSFRTFATEVIKLLLLDSGVQNAADNGYIEIPGQTLTVGDFKIEVDNIYIDELRLTFDTRLTNPKVSFNYDAQEYYRVECEQLEGLSVGGTYDNSEDKKSSKASIVISGDGIDQLLKNKEDKIDIELQIVKEYKEPGNDKESVNIEDMMLLDGSEIKSEVVGSTKFTINIPKEIYKNKKTYEINQMIKNEEVEVNIKKLQVSPTMMYLETKIKTDIVEETFGLYNLSILSDSGYSYKDSMFLSGIGKENSEDYTQTIVPSIYYDKGKKVNLKADGIIVRPNDMDIEIKVDDNYPKEINYFGSDMSIEKVKYKDGELNVYIKCDNDMVSHAGFSKLDGNDYVAQGMEVEEEEGTIYIFAFKTEEKKSYIFSLSMMMKYKMPINIEIPVGK